MLQIVVLPVVELMTIVRLIKFVLDVNVWIHVLHQKLVVVFMHFAVLLLIMQNVLVHLECLAIQRFIVLFRTKKNSNLNAHLMLNVVLERFVKHTSVFHQLPALAVLILLALLAKFVMLESAFLAAELTLIVLSIVLVTTPNVPILAQ